MTSVSVGPIAAPKEGPCIPFKAISVIGKPTAGLFSALGLCPTSFPNGQAIIAYVQFACEEAPAQVCQLIQTTFTLSNARQVNLSLARCNYGGLLGSSFIPRYKTIGGIDIPVGVIVAPTPGLKCVYTQTFAPPGAYTVKLWDCK